MATSISRRSFLKRSGATVPASGPLGALAVRAAAGDQPPRVAGYGPLVLKGDLWLPAAFNYAIVSRQGDPMSDGQPTPGIFDGMGAFPGENGRTILIRNHENREQPGEQKVVTPPALQYDPAMFGGNTKLEVKREKAGRDPESGQQLYTYEVVRSFAILGGTSTNCAGGRRSPHSWMTCEEVVKRGTKKHGYLFEIDARADGPVEAIPVPQCGRMAHEAAVERAGIIYLTEDRRISEGGACFYRYTPSPRGGGVPLHETEGPLEALAIKGAPRFNTDTVGTAGTTFEVEWVPVPEPDHDDDTDRTPAATRFQAQSNGAALFDREEGIWVSGKAGKIYFDCTSGGPANLGQVWEYDPGRETLTLLYVSTSPATLENPDNVVIVPQTNDVLLCEDGSGAQYVRGVTQQGAIYDFARTSEENDTEFCGACFDPDHQTLYVNQQGDRGIDESGQPSQGVAGAVTYAIYGPFDQRAGSNGNGGFGG